MDEKILEQLEDDLNPWGEILTMLEYAGAGARFLKGRREVFENAMNRARLLSECQDKLTEQDLMFEDSTHGPLNDAMNWFRYKDSSSE